MTAFAEALATHRPRLYITNSACHNPTGGSISAPVAYKLLKLAETHGLLIAEDDIFADFETAPTPRLAAFDGLERVIRVGSFSKSLGSAIRCGHIAARADWIAGLTDLRIATGMSGSPIAAELVQAMLTDGAFRRHMERVRGRLDQARALAFRRLATIGITPWTEPQAGLFVWGRLPHGVDSTAVTRHAFERDVVLAPGNVFSVARTATQYMRLNVAMMDDDRVFAVIEEAMALAASGR
jgi:DNA-binding transcriptional MocR family regulator